MVRKSKAQKAAVAALKKKVRGALSSCIAAPPCKIQNPPPVSYAAHTLSSPRLTTHHYTLQLQAKRATEEQNDSMIDSDPHITPSVWMPGCEMEEEETLDYDPTAYDCLTSIGLEWPCLSFDVVADALGDKRVEFPHCLSLVAGTQAAPGKHNYLAIIRLTNLTQGKHGAKNDKQKKEGDDGRESDDDVEMIGDSDSEDEEEDATFHVRKFAHKGGVNRVRCMPQNSGVVASWSDTSQVQVWDTGALQRDLVEWEGCEEGEREERNKKVHKMNAMQVYVHATEGYALDWSPCLEGRLASGDCKGRIFVWEPNQGRWSINGPMKGHGDSVEDLQWSPSEPTVFASASVDKTVRIWDTRAPSKAQIVFQAHEADVNVISWNHDTEYMMASGGDDGHLRVWDLRNLQAPGVQPTPVANFTLHRGPITSVEWAPFGASMLQTTSADNTLAVWDLAVERDPEEEAALAVGHVAGPEDLPPQLMFVHAGQQDVKEAHWHRQIPGLLVSTAIDGFNVFKPANVGL